MLEAVEQLETEFTVIERIVDRHRLALDVKMTDETCVLRLGGSRGQRDRVDFRRVALKLNFYEQPPRAARLPGGAMVEKRHRAQPSPLASKPPLPLKKSGEVGRHQSLQPFRHGLCGGPPPVR